MADFTQDIYNFRQYGTYAYKYDGVGNLTFNSSSTDFSQVYLALPLRNAAYNNPKVNSFYNIEFEEFIPSTGSSTSVQDSQILEEQLAAMRQENEALKSQLDAVIAQSEESGTVADQMATKQVILELRKSLGEGRVDSDFSETFPFTPFRKVTE
jgi:hypothetical protein